jgi:hypothetical protein
MSVSADELCRWVEWTKWFSNRNMDVPPYTYDPEEPDLLQPPEDYFFLMMTMRQKYPFEPFFVV